jgi:hypothetical protein
VKRLGEELQINVTTKNFQMTGEIGVEEAEANSVMSYCAVLGRKNMRVCYWKQNAACNKLVYTHN